MEKDDVQKECKFSYANLILMFGTKLLFLERDMEMFVKYNITVFNIDELKQLLEEFSQTWSDPEYIVEQKEATYDKKETFKVLRNDLNLIQIALMQSVSKKDLKNQIPEIFRLSDKKEQELINTAIAAHKIIILNKANLANFGINDSFIARFKTVIDQCEENTFKIGVAKTKRTDGTKQRRIITNKLWNNLQLFCKMGRLICEFENETAKYNDYVLPVYYGKKKKKKNK